MRGQQTTGGDDHQHRRVAIDSGVDIGANPVRKVWGDYGGNGKSRWTSQPPRSVNDV
jgi:hypothetical protein